MMILESGDLPVLTTLFKPTENGEVLKTAMFGLYKKT